MSAIVRFRVGMRVQHAQTGKVWYVTAVAPRGGTIDVEDEIGRRDCYERRDLVRLSSPAPAPLRTEAAA